MKIGFLGLGKLGLPVALAIESMGHEVQGFDINPAIADILSSGKLPYIEKGANELLSKTKITLHPPVELCEWADIIFIAVQTPHEPMYEGITPLPKTRRDFDYTYLIEAVKMVKTAKKVVVISTVLPGTIRREILPIKEVVYNPSFIAMGTTIEDFLEPEFVLMGSDNKESLLDEFYDSINKAPRMYCTIEEAEITKVSYNTFITAKICISNTIMELAHKIGNADCDVITNILSLATDRIISSKYMKGGMGDGGACHPRDAIAMSWLAKKLYLSYDIYEKLLQCRESQTKWLATIACGDNDVMILGKAFKKNTNITAGSPAILLTEFLKNWKSYDPYIDEDSLKFPEDKIGVYFIATEHDVFKTYKFPKGSVVIDPFRFIEPDENITLIRIGDGNIRRISNKASYRQSQSAA